MILLSGKKAKAEKAPGVIAWPPFLCASCREL